MCKFNDKVGSSKGGARALKDARKSIEECR